MGNLQPWEQDGSFVGQAAFVFIKGALGPYGHQGLSSHPQVSSGPGMSGCWVPSLAWSSLTGAPLPGSLFPETCKGPLGPM